MTIEGHADERGTREYNLALGERRANAAKDYLMTYGISGKRISVISYGKEKPVNPASSPLAWSQNRRSVTVKLTSLIFYKDPLMLIILKGLFFCHFVILKYLYEI